MFYILLVIFLFIVSVIAHIIFSRTTAQRALHAKVFIFIITVALVVYVGLVLALQHTHFLDSHSLWGWPFSMTAGFILILFVPIYLSFYVLTQLISPSQKILFIIGERTEVSYDEILANLREENLIMIRLSELCSSGCVTEVGGRYRLSMEGKGIVMILKGMEFALGRKVGG